ncbi:MAG: Asp-tRNA(Asn)/Glu-tRNA(Gln) amidotransferase subunit GatC [Halodesulfurarchaeum sp.]
MSNEPVDSEAVKRVAALARVELDDEEIDDFVPQFREILGYFDTLEEVPDVESEPDLVNVMRADEVEESLPQEAALQNATASEDGRFKGPRVS